MAKFDGKWPKMWPTCIFRHGEGSEGLKNGFAEPLHRGAEGLHRGAEGLHRGAEGLPRGAQSYLGGKKWPKSKISFCLVQDSLRGTF